MGLFDTLLRSGTNPVFYAPTLDAWIADEPERLRRIRHDPESGDLLAWNVFMSLDTHRDQDYYAYRMQVLGGSAVRAPVKVSHWTGRVREPLLRPNRDWVQTVRRRAASAGGSATTTEEAVAGLDAPVEVPVRVETPDVLLLVETVLDRYPTGTGGRDRFVELIDAGLDQARRLSKRLAVAAVYVSGTDGARQVSARLQELRDQEALAAALPHRDRVPPVALREMGWQQLVRLWETEIRYLDLAGQPVRRFTEHLRARGLL